MNNYEQGAALITRVRQEIAKEIIGQQNVVDRRQHIARRYAGTRKNQIGTDYQ